MQPNKVYGIKPDRLNMHTQVQTTNTDYIETTPNEVYGITTTALR